MADRIQIRRDTTANWEATNPVLGQGELGLELDTSALKAGDGVTAWNELGYTTDDATSPGGRLLFDNRNRTLYIDQAAGADTNGGELATDAFASWGRAMKEVPYILGDAAIDIRIVGNYDNAGSRLRVGPIAGSGGQVSIVGDSGVAGNHVVTGYFEFSNAAAGYYAWVQLKNLMVKADNQPVRVQGLSLIYIDSVALARVSAAVSANSVGLMVRSGKTYIRESDLGTDQFEIALAAHVLGQVYSAVNSGQGTIYGLQAAHGSVIAKGGAQPTGVTANEDISSGGVIR